MFKSVTSAPNVLETVSIGLICVVVVSTASVVSTAVVSASVFASVGASVTAVVETAEEGLLSSSLLLHPEKAVAANKPASRQETICFPRLFCM